MRIFLLAVCMSALAANASAGGVQAQCGSEAGTTFAAEGGLVSAQHAGWGHDSMGGETIIRVDVDSGEVDVRFRDATGIWQAPSDSGGSAMLFAAQDEPAAFMVSVVYPGATIEVLTIANIDGTRATLIHTLSRVTDRITNSRVMTATCSMSSF